MDIDLKGIRILELSVEPTDDGASGDNALWITPTIEYKSAKPETIHAGYAGKGPEMTTGISRKLADKSASSLSYPFPLLRKPTLIG